MKSLWRTLVLIVILTQMHAVWADVVVAPRANEAVEGSISNFYPFAIDIDDPADPLFNANPLTSQRYQQAYDSAVFEGFSGPLAISRISFRPNLESGGAFSATLEDIRISLSTTPLAMGELTTTFADNLGGDEQVFVDGPLTLSSSFTGPAGGPKDFDIHINLSTPFLYDPSQGNLLMDVRNYAGVEGDPPLAMVFDAEWTDSDIYRLYTTYPTLDGVDEAEATFLPGAMGLVTQFTFTPMNEAPTVPAPGAILLGTFGASLVGWLRRRTSL